VLSKHSALAPTRARSEQRDGLGSCGSIEDDGPTVFKHACKLGLEGIVSKRKDSPYRSGRSSDWLKSKNPACEAVRREEEEDWGR
jgi:ATP-dependent DNA ligase